jgi:hypothetical protein
MLGLRFADEVRVFLVVIVLPLREQFVAMPIAQFAQEFIGAVLDGPVAQRIHRDAQRQPSQWIVIFGARENRSLIAQPPDVAEKSKHQQGADADRNGNLCASEPHPEREFIGMASRSKITGERRGRTCTEGRKWGNVVETQRSCVSRLKLFLFVFLVIFGGLHAAIVRCLRFRVFHCFFGFRGLFGASFGTLFALFIEHFFAAQ